MLLLNFIGHGNESTLTEEEVFTVNDLPRLPAGAPLPIVVTAPVLLVEWTAHFYAPARSSCCFYRAGVRWHC
ncbi:hypothetical protein A3SI_03198 [Nitritalea halalkaliphila LW7]|uniref:Uncharacterized protein n=1 Tax=Nitritalea halalkaliphila LW7 TaxID=1189621 RepID=I5C9K6_9BACT|nr:hypothetical protein A3SI_03198 [Nitritalea halalkaliphila LW7]